MSEVSYLHQLKQNQFFPFVPELLVVFCAATLSP